MKELDRYSCYEHSALRGKKKRECQNIEYVLRFFGKRIGEDRKKYRSYVEKGISMGRRPELVGGGLIRSLGGWDEVKKMRFSGRPPHPRRNDHIVSFLGPKSLTLTRFLKSPFSIDIIHFLLLH